jgi:hypothetical protein
MDENPHQLEQPIPSVYDDSPPSLEEMREQLARSGCRAGWTDPEMDVYDRHEDDSRKA